MDDQCFVVAGQHVYCFTKQEDADEMAEHFTALYGIPCKAFDFDGRGWILCNETHEFFDTHRRLHKDSEKVIVVNVNTCTVPDHMVR